MSITADLEGWGSWIPVKPPAGGTRGPSPGDARTVSHPAQHGSWQGRRHRKSQGGFGAKQPREEQIPWVFTDRSEGIRGKFGCSVPSPHCAFICALQAELFPGLRCVSGRDAQESPPVSCPFEVSRAGPPSRSPPREALARPRADFLALASV